jgi:trans-2,3-dihydro-3-hydroxyanthranilate isomerase
MIVQLWNRREILNVRQYRFLQLDVFTDKPFAGNPLAVFPDAEGLSDEEMMQIAREMNLSETVFVLKPKSESATADEASETQPDVSNKNGAQSSSASVLRQLRIFTPSREIPCAGHPVV